MAQDVYSFRVTVPAGTPVATPQTTNLGMPPRTVTEVRVRVPPGPRGEVGFALGSAQQPVIPYDAGQWFVTDDEDVRLPLDVPISSGAWQLFAYNTGQYPHTLFVTFLCNLPGGGSLSSNAQPFDLTGSQI